MILGEKHHNMAATMPEPCPYTWRPQQKQTTGPIRLIPPRRPSRPTIRTDSVVALCRRWIEKAPFPCYSLEISGFWDPSPALSEPVSPASFQCPQESILVLGGISQFVEHTVSHAPVDGPGTCELAYRIVESGPSEHLLYLIVRGIGFFQG